MKKPAKVRTEQEVAIDAAVEGDALNMSDVEGAKKRVPTNRLAVFESALEATTDGLLIIGRENEIVKANARFWNIFGMVSPAYEALPSASDLIGTIGKSVVDSDNFIRQMRLSCEFPDNSTFDEIALNDGRLIERHSLPNVIKGETVGCVMSFRDITTEKLTEDTLRESESRYRLLFDHNPYPIWVYDIESLRFLAVNEEALKKYGYSRQEFLRLTVKDIRPSEDVPQFMEFLEASRNLTEVVRCVRHQAKNGTILDVEVAAQNIIYAGSHGDRHRPVSK
jgi:PAS domain S-box-containing protein